MRKKFLFFFLLIFFWEVSFWPAIFGYGNVPNFLLAFLIVLSGKIDFKETFKWFLAGGFLLEYFSPWPPLIELVVFLLICGGLFLLEKLFLWQRKSFLLEGWLLLGGKLASDLFKWVAAIGLLRFNWIDWKIEEKFIFPDYFWNLGFFVLFGLFLFFFFYQKERSPHYSDKKYWL